MADEFETWEKIAAAVAGCAEVADADTFAVVVAEHFGKLRRAQKDALARDAFRDMVRSQMRSATLAAERAAERTAPSPTLPKPVEREHWMDCIDDDCTDAACERGRQRRAEAAADDERRRSEFQAIVDSYTSKLKIEWTAELLASTFALDDGRMVTWGDATVDDHRERLAMFTRNAQANLEGAVRHQRAIDTLEQCSIERLADLAEVGRLR